MKPPLTVVDVRHARDVPLPDGWFDVAPDDPTWTHVISVDGRMWKRGEDWPMSIVAGGFRFVRDPTVPTAADLLDRVAAATECLDDADLFRACVADVLAALGIADIDFANELSVSRTTVCRWKNGRSVPHPAMRKPVYAALRRRIQAAAC
jgi:hypothetical protein